MESDLPSLQNRQCFGGDFELVLASSSNTKEEECKKITSVYTPLFIFYTPPLAHDSGFTLAL